MLKMPDTRGKYFSVKHSTKIQGAHYIPSVCYPLSLGLQAVVEKMAAEDTAKIYTEKVRFVTGVPYPARKPETSVAAQEEKAGTAVRPAAAKPPAAAAGKPGRKSGRSAYMPQTGREFD
jgi:hypothetical protein